MKKRFNPKAPETQPMHPGADTGIPQLRPTRLTLTSSNSFNRNKGTAAHFLLFDIQ
jgi:hypothetical protein